MKLRIQVPSLIAPWLPETCITVGLCVCGIVWMCGKSVPREEIGERRIMKAKERSPDCGAIAVYLISRLTNKSCSLDEVKKITNTTLLGTNMSDLKKAGETLGLSVEAVVCNYEKLCDHLQGQNTYAILYSLRRHYIVAIGSMQGNRVRIVDYGNGVFDLTESELLRAYGWDGATLLLTNSRDRN